MDKSRSASNVNGTWTVWVRNFPDRSPGSTTVVQAEAGQASTGTQQGAPAMSAVVAAIAGVIVGLGGLAPARRRERVGRDAG